RLTIAAERQLVRGALRDILPDLARQALLRQRLELEDVDGRRGRGRRGALRQRGARSQAPGQRADGAGDECDRLATFHAGILGVRPHRVKRSAGGGGTSTALRQGGGLDAEESDAVVPGYVGVGFWRAPG